MKCADRIYLRGFQIAACVRLGISTRQLFLEVDETIKAAAETDAWAIFGFVAQTVRLRASLDFTSAINDVRVAISVFPRLCQGEGPFNSLSPDLGPASLLWLIVMGIRTPQHLHLWLDILDSFPTEELLQLFDDRTNEGHQGWHLATNQVWMNEFLKPPLEREWQCVEQVLLRAQQLGQRRALAPLVLAAARSRIVVLDDYLRSLPAASSVAN